MPAAQDPPYFARVASMGEAPASTAAGRAVLAPARPLFRPAAPGDVPSFREVIAESRPEPDSEPAPGPVAALDSRQSPGLRSGSVAPAAALHPRQPQRTGRPSASVPPAAPTGSEPDRRPQSPEPVTQVAGPTKTPASPQPAKPLQPQAPTLPGQRVVGGGAERSGEFPPTGKQSMDPVLAPEPTRPRRVAKSDPPSGAATERPPRMRSAPPHPVEVSRVVLTPPAPAASGPRAAPAGERASRRTAGSHEVPTLRIGTIEVQIVQPPRHEDARRHVQRQTAPVPRTPSAPRALARGFGSFGFTQS